MATRETGNPLAAGTGIALARGVSRGDPAALATFYGRWFDRVFLAARRMTGRDESFCLDVVQEVMLKVARKLRPVKSDEELEQWMSRVTRTTAIDLMRREQRRRARELGRTAAAGSTDPHELVRAEELRVWWREAAAGLTNVESSLLEQRVAHGRTLEEVAAMTGLTASAVHGRVRRTLGRLGEDAKEMVV